MSEQKRRMESDLAALCEAGAPLADRLPTEQIIVLCRIADALERRNEMLAELAESSKEKDAKYFEALERLGA